MIIIMQIHKKIVFKIYFQRISSINIYFILKLKKINLMLKFLCDNYSINYYFFAKFFLFIAMLL